MTVRTARRISRHEELRRQAGLLTTQLADKLDFSHAYVSLIEAGEKKASPRYRDAFSDLVGARADFIFDEAGWVR